MPANEEYLRDPKLMHRVFCGSSLLVLLTTMWMMWADYNDEWRVFQRQAYKFQAERLKGREQSLAKNPDHEKRVEELSKKVESAQEAVAKAEDKVKARKEAVEKAAETEKNHLTALKLMRAERDVARAQYNLAIRDSDTISESKIAEYLNAYEKSEKIVQENEVKESELKLKLSTAKDELAEITGDRDAAAKALAGEQTNIKLIHAAWEKIDPDKGLAKWKRKMMLIPIIEGFNSPERVIQDWLPKLEITLGGMTMVSRFDRCRTCHLSIDNVDDTVKTTVAGAFPHGDGKGEFKHPYASHPRLDVYLSATSPHPLPKFGCTVCHEGQGSGTSFANASHTPNDPAEMEEWTKKDKWFDNHFWERPMYPRRFEESGCIKCHINVTELAVNEKFGPTAPKVARGHQLIQKYGCFGCHEISGYDGTKIIGPDLRLEPSTPEDAAEIANDPTQVAGKMRKVGPSLRHLASKSSDGFVRYWTEEPKRFRPTTRMPQFFKLDNQDDHTAHNYNPVEIAAMSYYLMTKSQPLETLAPAADYKPNAERGKALFATKGCVVCHSHQDVPAVQADFGPELSRVHAKLQAGNKGFNWLYTWIREPERHHPRTKMPHLFLDAEGTGDKTVDPAADIAAFLLKLDGPAAEFKPTQTFDTPEVPDAVLNDLVKYFMMKVLTKSQAEKVMETGKYPFSAANIKGDEVELASEGETSPEEFKNRKLSYLGRKTIGRYGCYGCHDIPGFEKGRPIGTALQDWGKKDRSRLAFEHIHEYLHHNGNPDLGVKVEAISAATAARLKHDGPDGVRIVEGQKGGRGPFKVDDIVVSIDGHAITSVADYEATLARTVVGTEVAVIVERGGHLLPEPICAKADASLQDRIESGIGRLERHEFTSAESEDREASAAFYYESLMHHGRPGFLWQKLRQPRSYDYKMIETKPYDDRLRMPKFPLTEKEIDEIATFVVGLVAEPPATEYLYNPGGAKGARIRGEQLIEQFNCSGCHMLELPKIRYGADVESITASDASSEYPAAVALLRKLRPFANGLTGETKKFTTADGVKSLAIVQFHGMVAGYPNPEDDVADQEYIVESWESLLIAGKELFPTSKFIFPALSLDRIEPARGGRYAEWLVNRLVDDMKASDPSSDAQKSRQLAWQSSPPPLYKEGTKVQTQWLFNFLRNPGRLRHTTVLRMPRFNMSDDEAKALSNYFAAVDGTEFPYQLVAERDARYLHEKDAEFHKEFPDKKNDYLNESWRMLNAELCIKCHSVGGRQVVAGDPKTAIRGPNLDLVSERLKPDWTQLWLYRPQWITPYTSMPSPFPPQKPGDAPRNPELFGGDGLKQTIGLRDALVNYYKLMEREGKVATVPQAAAPEAGAGGND